MGAVGASRVSSRFGWKEGEGGKREEEEVMVVFGVGGIRGNGV